MAFTLPKSKRSKLPWFGLLRRVREEVSKDWWQEARDESLKKVIQELKAQAVIEEIEEAEEAEEACQCWIKRRGPNRAFSSWALMEISFQQTYRTPDGVPGLRWPA